MSKQDCIKLLARNGDLWRKDSLATNGFRRLLGEEFLSRCGDSLIGVKWSDIAVYLGKPHATITVSKFLESGEVAYRYVLFTYGKYQNWTVPGTLILHITVLGGMVKSFWVQEMDG